MSPPGTAREALLAEALGELGRLLDRMEAIAPRIDAASHALGQSADRFDREARKVDQQLAGFTDRVQVQAVRHIAGRTDELARQALAQLTTAMEATALEALRRGAEATATGRRRSTSSDAGQGAWLPSGWLVPVCSALLASAGTWLLAWWCMPLR